MISFKLNPYFINNTQIVNKKEIQKGITIANESIKLFRSEIFTSDQYPLIGIGNDAGGRVYSLKDTKFCLKISKLGEHVGINQEK